MTDERSAGTVAEGNRDMSAAWDGDEGEHWAEHAERYERGATPYREALVTAAALHAGERVLDIGCGAGRTTREAARAVAPGGQALGVDLSSAMLQRARQRATEEGLDNVRFAQADAQVQAFDSASFDVVISQFGSMFFADPVAAFANIAQALAPGGRVLLVVWQGLQHNEWAATMRSALAAGRDLPMPPPGAPGPFSMTDPDVVRRVLTEAGLTDVAVEPVDGDFNLGPDPDEAFAFVRGMGITRSLLADLDAQTATRALDDLRAAFADHVTPAGVVFRSAAWLVTARKG
ncbi:MAG: hypothetical protein QOJ03_3312 [Frankiaceae bacterium]|nr:hypothetical protein [Frankiaceae bacterium]